MQTTEANPRLSEFLARLNDAVVNPDGPCCYRVKSLLEDVCTDGVDWIPDEYLQPSESGYARRLVYLDPANRYSVMVMVWNIGQGTSLHDHAGMWCVECVYRGRIKVVSYDLDGFDGEKFQFDRKFEVHAGPGEAGALIPPFDYHTIENDHPTPSATIHIYGGEMNWCHAYVPDDGGYRKIRRELTYSSD